MHIVRGLHRLAIGVVRAAAGCVLLVPAAVLILALPEAVRSSLMGRPAWGWLLLGFLGGFVVFAWGPGRTVSRALYVFGHELTHWLVARGFRRRTGPLRVGLDRGFVMVERPNIWITLAPYFVPLYTVSWIGLYGAVRLFQGDAPPGPALAAVFLGGVGATYAFHLYWTGRALLRGQPDLRVHGVFFSIAFVLFWNVLFIYAAVVMAGRDYGRGWTCLVRAAARLAAAVHGAAAGLADLAG